MIGDNVKPGGTVPDSGIYELRNTAGDPLRRATMVKGDHAPPAPKRSRGAIWYQVADTNPDD